MGRPPCLSPPVAALVLVGVLARRTASHEYCARHPERPCWGVRKTLIERPHYFGHSFDNWTISGPFHFHAVDWDGDGHLDLLHGNDDAVRFYQGDPNGGLSFQEDIVILGGVPNPIPHAVDLDKDGHMDLIVGSSTDTQSVRFYQGGASGTLSERTGADSPFWRNYLPWPSCLQAVDWDGDGRMELLVELLGGRHVLLRLGADGRFYEDRADTLAVLDHFGTDPWRWFQAVDWDGDGYLDLLVGLTGNRVRWARGSADGSLSKQDGEAGILPDVTFALDMPTPQAVDWDGDGHMDLLVGDHPGPRFFQGGVASDLREQHGVDNPFRGVAGSVEQVVDWDGDGHADLIVMSPVGRLGFFRRSADGSLIEAIGADDPFASIVSNKFTMTAIEAVDWDGDGRRDLMINGFVSRQSGVNHYLDFYLGNGDGGLIRIWPDPFFGGIPNRQPWQVQAVDWDGDGHMDLLLWSTGWGWEACKDAVESCVGAVRLLLQGADGGLLEEWINEDHLLSSIQGVHGYGIGLHVVDWDGDSHKDLIAYGERGLRFFQGAANGSLSQQTGAASLLPDTEAVTALQVVDWDGDGRWDLFLRDQRRMARYFSTQCDSTVAGQRAVCAQGGWCEHVTGRCVCATSNDNPDAPDCSLCADFFYKAGEAPLCRPCPGVETSAGPCSRRGTCLDSRSAREAQTDGTRTPTQAQAPGDGTCTCAHPFSGSNCEKGECPAGFELIVTGVHVNSSSKYPIWEVCAECSAGRHKARPGNHPCGPCEPGTFQSASGATGCDRCPPGRVQPLDGSPLCETCEAGSAPSASQKQCLACSAGRQASSGQEECSSCLAGLVPTEKRDGCEPCSAGQAPSTNQSKCAVCSAGRHARSGDEKCSPCQGALVPTGDRSDCQLCRPGQVPSADQAACEACSAGRHARAGDGKCSSCGVGLVPTNERDGCQQCSSGWFVPKNEWECQPCPVLKTSEEGSSACHFYQAVLPSAILMACTAVALCVWLWWRRQSHRALCQAMQGSSAEKMRKALEVGSKFRLRKVELHRAEKHLHMLEAKYVDHEYLLKVVEEGDLRLIKGSWLANEQNGQRLRRQQDLPPEAFWAVNDLRSELRAVLFVAVSYCWLHEVHPDPTGAHLRTLRHAIKLRLRLQGPGQVVDIALFLDFCSLAQHGERGDPACPERGDFRSPEQQASFARGLRQVNILYANQSVEVWMMQWTPANEPRKYIQRGWPFFEQAVAALIKDAAQLLLILPESEAHHDWLMLYHAAVGGRQPPLTPAQFNKAIDLKTFTSPNTDKAFVIGKYRETFHDVLGHVATLWFASLHWGDEQVEQVAQVLPHCHCLEHLFLGSNHITVQGAARLAAAARACPVRGMDLSANLIEEHEEEEVQRLWRASGKDPALLRMSRAAPAAPVFADSPQRVSL